MQKGSHVCVGGNGPTFGESTFSFFLHMHSYHDHEA
jgi:hypothetical protein